MAKRWYMEFKDDNGNSITVNINDSLFTGAATLVNGGSDPVIIDYMAQGDPKYTNIKAAECSVELVTSTSLQYIDIFAATNKRFSCEVYRGGVRVFYGHASPEYYREPFICPPYITTAKFTDGLVELKNVNFTPDSKLLAGIKQTTMRTIASCLYKTGLSLPISAALDLKFDAETERILEKLYNEHRAFRDDSNYWSCYDVLNELLKAMQARLYQTEGGWFIERPDHRREDHSVELYSSLGAYASTSTKAEVWGLTAVNEPKGVIRFINTPAQLEVAPAAKKFTVTQDYGQRTNILNFNNFDGNFYSDEYGDTGGAIFWHQTGTATRRRVQDHDALQIDNVIGGGTNNDYIYSDEVDMDYFVPNVQTLINQWRSGDLHLRFKIKTKVNYDIFLEDKKNLSLLINAVLNMRIVADFSGTKYYYRKIAPVTFPYPYDEDEMWYTNILQGVVSWSLQRNGNKPTEWAEIDVIIPSPPPNIPDQTSVKFQLRMYLPVWESDDPDIGTEMGDGIMFKGVQLYFERTADGQEYIDSETYTIDEDNLLKPEDYKVKFGSTPEVYPIKPTGSIGHCLTTRRVFFDAAGDTVKDFGTVGDVDQDLIFDVNRNNLMRTYQGAGIKLRGKIIDKQDVLSFRTVLKDYDSRYYLPISMKWSVKHCTFDGDWLHFWPSALQGDFNEDFGEDFFID